MSRTFLSLVEGEYRRYKTLGEHAIEQLEPDQLSAVGDVGNSVATIVWHIAGNFESRFTDFLTTDGEKPWRDRENEFRARDVSPDELGKKWARGWDVLFDALAALMDRDLSQTVTIRGVELRADEALLRSLAHASYHVGQIVFRAKELRGGEWRYLSIAPGGSAAYNQNPTLEKGFGAPEPGPAETS